jgi:hypothetical protein
VPALKGTRTGVSSGLQAAAGRGSSLRFGAGWTAIIVVQVALMVVLLPTALLQAWDAVRALPGAIGFPASEYLAAALQFDGVEPEPARAGGQEADAHFIAQQNDARVARRAAMLNDLAARVAQEPDVTGVALADGFPGMSGRRGAVEIDGESDGVISRDRARPQSYTATVAPGFFGALQVPVLTGRAFTEADVVGDRPVAIVNQLFVSNILGGRNPLGRRVRFVSADPAAPWFEIVGVVPDLGFDLLHPEQGAGLYRAAAAGTDGVTVIAVHVASGASSFAPRLRAIAFQVDPDLRVAGPSTLDVIGRADQVFFRFFALAFGGVALIGIVLSTTGIYSMLSFTVSRRTREIAIRAALGANPRRIVFTIFSRAALQVGAGATAGVVMLLVARPRTAREVWLPIALAFFVCVVGVFACAAPARRALRIEPSDALKDA